MKHKRFFDFFPPPTFLTMPAVGLSIESDLIRLVSFERKHHNVLRIKNVEEYKLEQGVIVGGEIKKPEKIVAVLKNIQAEHGVRFVRLAIPEEKAYVYETVVPVPEGGDLNDAVEFSLDQNIPLSPAETVFDFSVVEGPFANAGAQSVRVVVSAYPRTLVETWIELLTQAGITPLLLTPESQAIANSLISHGDNKTSLLVHFLKDKTILAVVSDGSVRFSTTVSHDPEQFEKVLASHEGEKISESIELLAVRDEAKKVYSYWMSKEHGRAQKEPRSIKSVIVTGHVADMTDVAEYIGKHIGAPAYLGNVWQNVFSLNEVVPEIVFEDSLPLAVAVGVALPRHSSTDHHA